MKRKKNLITTISKPVAAFLLIMGMVLSAGIGSKAAAPKVDNGNNSILNAVDIDLNTTYAGNIVSEEEDDWYHFVIPAAAKGYFNVVLGPENSNFVSDENGWLFSIYKKGEAEPFYEYLNSSDYKQGGIKNKTTSINFPFGPGEYYLKIEPYNNYYSEENYNFSVAFTNNAYWEIEDNNSLTNATPIRVNEIYHGNLYCTADEDCYTFTVSKPGEVVVNIGPDSSVDITKFINGWELCMYKDGEASPYIDLRLVKQKTSSKSIKVSAGTYKIRICAETNYKIDVEKNYDLSVTYKETQAATTTNNKKTVTTLKKSKVTVSSAKSKVKKKVYLKWKKNKYADGYKVYRSMKKKTGYKCIATLKKASKVSYTDKKVKSKKVYYYKVRAYRKNGKKTVYSGYSPVKKVKVK